MKYYSKQTERAIINFPFPLPKVSIELIYSIVLIKKAAALANRDAGLLNNDKCEALLSAADEILRGKLDDQFITCSLQGGAGTSINMNANEVLAVRASELTGLKIHPNDHANLSQSTNDVNPSALRILCIRLTNELLNNLDFLINAFEQKGQEFKNIKKLGRTHLQDAVPTTLGAEMCSYAAMLLRSKKRLIDTEKYLYELSLGGTAIGNSINAPDGYIINVYKHLHALTGLKLKPAENLMSFTSSMTDFAHLIATLTQLTVDLSKISNDLRILSSGPNGGIGEIILEELQSGSSIMPGKVNPVIPESMNQIHYFVSGKSLTVHMSAEASFLELANMFPVVAESMITSLKLVSSGIKNFAEKCVITMRADEKRCLELLERSTAYATLLTPKLGYDKVSEIVKKTVSKNKTIRELMITEGLLNNEQFDELVA